MGVYIKNMEMPTNCWFCSVKSWDDDEYVCPFSGRTVKSGDINRNEDCPLIEISAYHGDLVDVDTIPTIALQLNVNKTCTMPSAAYKLDFSNVPVVIPAEKDIK